MLEGVARTHQPLPRPEGRHRGAVSSGAPRSPPRKWCRGRPRARPCGLAGRLSGALSPSAYNCQEAAYKRS